MESRKVVRFLLGFILIWMESITPLRADKPGWCGIWAQWGGENVSNADKPWYKGCLGTTSWRTIEPVRGQYDFTEMDQFIYTASKNGLYVGYMVYIGASSPKWIYDAGVPRVQVGSLTYPYYIDEDYKSYLKAMIKKVVEHIQSYPPAVRNKIAFMQCPAGTSGDPQPWNGIPSDPQYVIPADAWEKYNKEIFSAYVDSYKVCDPPISLLMKPREDNFNELNSYVPNLFLKTYTVAQGYQTNDDMKYEWLRLAVSRFQEGGRAIRVRGEMAHIDLKTSDWFDEAPLWNIYTQCLWALTYGMDVLNFREQHLTGNEALLFEKGYNFFSAYAGYKAPEDSHGAWCALRDGLDYDDRVRFPEETYGVVGDGKNIPRYLSIANAFADKGAKMGETEYCFRGGVDWTKYAKAMNDVARKPWPGNYGMFMTQYKPNETSRGMWRVGSKDDPYGRFARSFDNATGKDKMYFNIEDAFFFGNPLSALYPVTVRVVYFDQGTGSWELQYDAKGNSIKTAFSVKKTNTGKWKEIIMELKDANFGNRCPNGTDLMLVNTDSENDIFHMVEVTRKTGDRKGYWGYVKSVPGKKEK